LVSDSGPNLGVRGVAGLLLLAGLLLISTGYRIRKGTSRWAVPPTVAGYRIGAFVVAGVVAVGLGAFLLGAGF
jgi:hypothetical protein